MSISCGCKWDADGEDWYYFCPDDFTKLSTKRSRRCISCGTKIQPGDECVKFQRERNPQHDVEVRIYGEGGEIPMAPWFMCEECGGVYLSITELGYCINLKKGERMRDLAREIATW